MGLFLKSFRLFQGFSVQCVQKVKNLCFWIGGFEFDIFAFLRYIESFPYTELSLA